MAKLVRIIAFGIAIWAIAFGSGMAVLPLVPPETALFDTLMAVAMAFAASIMSVLYFTKSENPTWDEGLLTGTVWLLMSISLDIPLFIFGPDMMRMAPADYLADIGITYFMIPCIAAGVASAAGRR